MVMHLLHDWAPWGEPVQSEHRHLHTQARVCRDCGKLVIRRISAYGLPDLSPENLKKTYRDAMRDIAESSPSVGYQV